MPRLAAAESELDLVVPFTDPAMTRAAVAAASTMARGLRAALRLVRVQVVPFPCDLNHPLIPLSFLRGQLEGFRSTLPIRAEVRLAREMHSGLSSALRPDSVVVLASKKRWWRTRTERLAAALRRAGYRTVLFYEGDSNA